MESNILTKKLDNATNDKLDLSESGGAWFSCNGTPDKSDSTYGDHRDDPFNGTEGGTAELAAESISSGYGAYPEELTKYDDVENGYAEALRYYSDYKFKDYSKLPEDINLIKHRLMEKGAMYYTYISFRKTTTRQKMVSGHTATTAHQSKEMSQVEVMLLHSLAGTTTLAKTTSTLKQG